jgi:hypothetical protein
MKQRTSITALAVQAEGQLDRTHAIGERGPKTFLARKYLAAWLDTGRGSIRKVQTHIKWLRGIS